MKMWVPIISALREQRGEEEEAAHGAQKRPSPSPAWRHPEGEKRRGAQRRRGWSRCPSCMASLLSSRLLGICTLSPQLLLLELRKEQDSAEGAVPSKA